MRLSSYRSVAVTLALCAMVLRALLPDGWMPAATAGPAPFVICSIDGIHSGGNAPSKQEHSHAPCAFAAAAPLSPPATAPLAFSALPLVAALAFEATDRAPVRQILSASNAPRAPPSFS
ncbi:MAG TPA: hypothetical protein VJ476_01215 [Rhizomicrobium sp.]|nr:hypothetical protein [Rhizomicrobium sp.]